ncbi:hypothetical protein PS6_008230 [Mucor atramentarius]
MFNLQAPIIRQFIQHIASKLQSSTTTHEYHSSSKKTPSLSLCSTQDFDDQEDYFRYAPSSIYSADSFCDSVFEKTYVSFPDFTPSTTSNRALFTKPEVMTATATPMFYNTPRSKPIWIA